MVFFQWIVLFSVAILTTGCTTQNITLREGTEVQTCCEALHSLTFQPLVKTRSIVKFDETDSAGVIQLGDHLSYYNAFSLDEIIKNDYLTIHVYSDINTIYDKDGFFYPEFKLLDQQYNVIQSLDPNMRYVDFKKNAKTNRVSKEYVKGKIKFATNQARYLLVFQAMEKETFSIGYRMSNSMPIRVGSQVIYSRPTLKEEKIKLNNRGHLLFIVE